MLEKTLAWLAEQTKMADEPRLLLETPWTKVYAIGGMITPLDVPRPARAHEVGSVEEIVHLANRFKEAEAQPVVWYDEGDVRLVIDDDDGRADRVSLSLTHSDVFACVCKLRASKPWFEHKAFIRLLRIDLAGTLPPAALLDRIRKISLENNQVVLSKIGKQNESMGRSVNSAVSGEGEIPEMVNLQLPVYKTMGEGEAYALSCSVEVDPTRLDAFRLLPLPDEIERVGYAAVASIALRLEEGLNAGIPHYYGQP